MISESQLWSRQGYLGHFTSINNFDIGASDPAILIDTPSSTQSLIQISSINEKLWSGQGMLMHEQTDHYRVPAS